MGSALHDCPKPIGVTPCTRRQFGEIPGRMLLRPHHEAIAATCEHCVPHQHHAAGWNTVRWLPMAAHPPLAPALTAPTHQALGGEAAIDGTSVRQSRSFPKRDRSLVTALEAGTVPGRECMDLIKEEQLGVAVRCHQAAAAPLPFRAADNPRIVSPRLNEASLIVVQNAAIAHQVSAKGQRKDIASGYDAVHSGHSCQDVRRANRVAMPAVPIARAPARVIARRTLGRRIARRILSAPHA